MEKKLKNGKEKWALDISCITFLQFQNYSHRKC